MKPKELKAILEKHRLWLEGDPAGERADLREADLREADLRDSKLSKANLWEAKLREAVLWRADLSGADLRGADLRGADLSGAYLRGADLWGANLRGADLQGAYLTKANLREANLRGAYMWSADLRGANLTKANLQEANLRFSPAFSDSFGQNIYQASCGFGSRNSTLTLHAEGEREKWRWFTGCFRGNEAELRAAVKETLGKSGAGKRYMLAINYLISIAESNKKEQKEA